MCGPEGPFFTPLLQFARVPFQAKESVHKTPFWENWEILASTASIFVQFLALKPQNLEIFSSQAPLSRAKYQYASPTLRKSVPHIPTWKKVECPPGSGDGPSRHLLAFCLLLNIFLFVFAVNIVCNYILCNDIEINSLNPWMNVISDKVSPFYLLWLYNGFQCYSYIQQHGKEAVFRTFEVYFQGDT